MDINSNFDSRNIKLWSRLSSQYEIDVRIKKCKDYQLFLKGKNAIIDVPSDNINSASFTHELLHIYLASKGVYISGGLKYSIKENKKMSKIISEKLIDHIGNCLEHIKMLPEFLNLGYDKSEFISDYSVNKLTFDEINKLKNNFKASFLFMTIYKSCCIDFYIGKYFAVSSCPNNNYDYQKQLIELKSIDKELFDILETFLTNWKKYDYNDNLLSYSSFLSVFLHDLNIWIDNKKLIYCR
jgi:hypothetical protein